MENVNKPILIAGGKPVNSQWNKKNDLNDIDTILKLNPTSVEESQPNTDYEPDFQDVESYNRSEGARLGDISKTVFNTGGEKTKIVNVPSPIDQTQDIPSGKVGNVSAPTTQIPAPRTTINDSVVPPSTTGSVIPTPTTNSDTRGALFTPTNTTTSSATSTTTSSGASFNPVFVSDIDAVMNAARDSFNWQKHGLPEFGLGMTDEQKQYLYYQTDYLEVSAKDREKPVDMNYIATQLNNPNSKLSKYVVNSRKAISDAGGVIKGDGSVANLAKVFKALAASGKNIYDIAAQTNDGDMIEVSDLTFSVKDINFPGIDESKQAEANQLRKKFYDFLAPILDRGHQLGQVMGYLDQIILKAIQNGPKSGSLNGQIIKYYPEKGEFSSSIAIYTDQQKRPPGYWNEVNKYFDSMMELAGKPKETPINS